MTDDSPAQTCPPATAADASATEMPPTAVETTPPPQSLPLRKKVYFVRRIKERPYQALNPTTEMQIQPMPPTNTSSPSETEKLEDARLIRLPELMALTGLKRSSLYNRLNEKSKHFDADFPKRVKLNHGSARSGAVGWRQADVRRWLGSRPEA